MSDNAKSESMRGSVRAAISASVLLIVTVMLGAALGLLTQAQFRDIQKSWVEYSEGPERKGILISEVRGLLGYGGIIHNFKNYVLRQEPAYLDLTRAQLEAFDQAIAGFRALDLSPQEQVAVDTLEATLDEYASMLPIAVQAAAENWSVERTDTQVRVDDTDAIAAIAELEQIWSALQTTSSNRVLTAVGQGQKLIWIGFLSIFALLLAAIVVGCLLYRLIRDLHHAVADLAEELAERKRLEKSEGQLATAVEQSPATIIITDTHARIQYVNTKFTELTGWALEDVAGQTPAFLQSGETEERVYQEIRTGLANGEAWHGVFRNRKKDGTNYWAETTILPLLAKDGSVQNFIGISEDITEKRRARDQVVRAQKLEAVGQLAGGVAHDFNNILTTIVGSTHLASLDAEEGSDLAGEIAQIDIAARRAQSLIRELLTFARREPAEMKSVDLGAIVEEVIGLLKASVPPMITITHTQQTEALFVRGDPTHLHQIVMNLCRNAAEAMAGKHGEITLSIRPAESPPTKDPNASDWVTLTVADDGPGMSPDTLRHLFEPFFTTKPLGKGSGLGLSVVYGLVEEMGGQVSVASELGEGSTFTIDLPRVEATADNQATDPADIPRGTERLILIDDEAEVVGTFQRLLQRLGYRVEAFTSPRIALERYRIDPSRFDLVISDMVMPDMSGEDLVREIRGIRPDVPVIFCSAYKPRVIDVPGECPVMLDKPVQPAQLALVTRKVLDESVTVGS